LGSVDALVLTEVYAAGEAPIVAADGRALARALRVAGRVDPLFVENVDDLPQAILDAARDGDVVITMGAGSIGGVPGKIAGCRGIIPLPGVCEGAAPPHGENSTNGGEIP
ncbi:MAG: hypothetical protein LBI62_04900, partial [Candidatus Accumulibacter sp.]|nr:hypothetical protein [Accumulibacter sp.]